jgi:ubiquinone/menaquinone biosynthesis C-methylase UbiE
MAATDATRAFSFGQQAETYDRFRPAPPPAAVEWVLSTTCPIAVDVGAGTGALSRRMAERAASVVAVEPDMRMLSVLARRSPTVLPVEGLAEHLPLGHSTVDAVMISSAWHWMDPQSTITEIARVLRPGGVLGVLWNGPDRSVGWVGDLLGRRDPQPDDRYPPGDRHRFELPDGAPFGKLDRRVIAWSLAMTTEELQGLAATYSANILLPEAGRAEQAEQLARRLATEPRLRDGTAVAVPMRCRCFRAVRQ